MFSGKISPFLALVTVIAAFMIIYPSLGTEVIYIDINSPQIRKFYLAMPPIYDITSVSQQLVKEFEETLVHDLILSDLFHIMTHSALPQQGIFVTENNVDYMQWMKAGAEFLLSIGIKSQGDVISAECRLFDVMQHIYIAGKRYKGKDDEIRLIAHRMSDAIVQHLTGERGIFLTKIAFVTDRTGNKEIAISDIDGHNLQMATKNGSINISPAWHPNGTSLLFTCFRRRNADLYQLSLNTGMITLLSAAPGLNAAAQWSPDGKKVVLMMRGSDNVELFLIEQDGKNATKLTNSWGNKSSPAWAPDGKQIAFVSDRSGSPQIYILDLASRKERRLTYEGKYNCKPAWSPKGDKILFARLEEGRFNIYSIKPDGTGLKRLSQDGNCEDPSWAPNGRHFVYTCKKGDNYDIYIMTADGGGPWQVTNTPANETQPAWSPWLN